MSVLLSIGIVLAMLACVLLIPLGLPGLWIIAAGTLVLALFDGIGWSVAIGVAIATAVAEVAEFVVLGRLGKAFGGSGRAFWGAVVGGMVGLFIGTPVPVVGSIVTAFVGSFLGAGIVTFIETGSFDRSARVGWGVLLARTVAVGLKVAISMAVIAVVGFALLFSG